MSCDDLPMTDSLKATLQTDLTAAMRAREQVRVATLRMALSAISTEEVAGTDLRTAIALLDRILEPVAARQAELMSPLTRSEQEDFLALCRKLAAGPLLTRSQVMG